MYGLLDFMLASLILLYLELIPPFVLPLFMIRFTEHISTATFFMKHEKKPFHTSRKKASFH
jgi:hypothetical protein